MMAVAGVGDMGDRARVSSSRNPPISHSVVTIIHREVVLDWLDWLAMAPAIPTVTLRLLDVTVLIDRPSSRARLATSMSRS